MYVSEDQAALRRQDAGQDLEVLLDGGGGQVADYAFPDGYRWELGVEAGLEQGGFEVIHFEVDRDETDVGGQGIEAPLQAL